METKALKKQMGAAIAMVLVAAIALAASTYAWFVSNTKVSATTSSVSATSATPNLLIKAGANTDGKALTTGGMTADTAVSTNATALYPASSDNTTNWWVVNSWTNSDGLTLANGYYSPQISLADANTAKTIQNGQYTQGSETLNAYQVATYSVYTTTGEVDLNLDPENPISVTVNGDTGDARKTGFKDALRVGIVVDDNLKVVYAPTAESNDTKGNDKDAAAGYRTVATGNSTKQAAYTTLAGDAFTGWTAKSISGGVYSKADKSLGTVNTNGSVVKVYIWLEGTDADCLVGKADANSDSNKYQVKLNLVGATQDATTAQA